MKHCMTPEVSASGKPLLRFQCEGVEFKDLWNTVQGLSIVAFAMGEEHTFSASWTFQLIFDDGSVLQFSSAATSVAGWEEYGSLNILLGRSSFGGVFDTNELGKSGVVTDFPVTALEKLIWESDDLITECGLVFCGQRGEEIVVSTGIPPCSVSIGAPFSVGYFKPEFPAAECKRERL